MNKLIALALVGVAVWCLFLWPGAGHNPFPFVVAAGALVLAGVAAVAEVRRLNRLRRERELGTHG